jgi:azurin
MHKFRLSSRLSGVLALLLGVLFVPGCPKGKQEVRLDIASVGETMTFDKKELTVPAGSRVTLTLKNNATSPVMTHNWILVQKGKVEEVGQAAVTVPADQGHLPKNAAIIAHTPLSKPGETVTVTFDAPPPGTYEFVCSTPGHYMLMRGTFTVQ